MLENKTHIYLIGIGGIGMSALAAYFLLQGKEVAGYDRTPSRITEQLSEQGARISFDEDPQSIPEAFKHADQTLVIYTPAIPAQHRGKNYLQEQGFELKKRSEVLGMLSRQHPTLAVAGTHGKTTTSALLTHLFKEAQRPYMALVGGLMLPERSNFFHQGPLEAEAPLIVEADEYDRSFHRLKPQSSILTAARPDHLDIYGDEQSMQRAFRHYLSLVETKGSILVEEAVPKVVLSEATALVLRYGWQASNDYAPLQVEMKAGTFHFDLKTPKGIEKGFRLPMLGRHNLLNAVAALGLALEYGLDGQQCREALAQFKGIWRRFELKLNTSNAVLVDDYAHHPDELAVLLDGLREAYPQKTLTVVFQPHLYSRTRDFQQGFAEVLGQADELALLPIYPAREEPIPGVDSGLIAQQITTGIPVKELDKEELNPYVAQKQPALLAMLGAGDIDRLVEPIKNTMQHYA